jgi:hypothetical protein
MKKMLRIYVFCFCLVCAAAGGMALQAGAQVRFTARFNPPVIGKDEMAQLDLTVENGANIEGITPPVLTDFTIVSGPSQSTGYMNNNGVTTSSFTLSYLLRPRKKGVFNLGIATAIVDGKTFSSNRATLKVVDQPVGNNAVSPFTDPFGGMADPFAAAPPEPEFSDIILKDSENPADKLRQSMFIVATADRTSCYVGEPVVVTYKLYTRLKSDARLSKNPSFNGFSVVDLQQPDISRGTVEAYKGRQYIAYIIRKAQLYPLQSGDIALESAEIETSVNFIKEAYVRELQRNNPGQDLRFSEASVPPDAKLIHQATLSSNSLIVKVRPLPEASQPDSYKGAVGTFVLSASVDNEQMTTDDAGRLVLAISGSGNIPMITAPEIAWPQGIEGFEPKMTEDFTRQQVPVSGTLYYEYPFTADSPGVYELPAIVLAYFDPETGQYKQTKANPIRITVQKGTGKPRQDTTTSQTGKERFFNTFFNNRWWIAGPLIALILIGLLAWLIRENRRQQKEKQLQKTATVTAALEEIRLPDPAVETQPHPLQNSSDLLDASDQQVFFAALLSDLHRFLTKQYGIAAEDQNRKYLETFLDKKGIDNTTVRALLDLMETLERTLYTPWGEERSAKTFYEEALSLVEELKLT